MCRVPSRRETPAERVKDWRGRLPPLDALCRYRFIIPKEEEHTVDLKALTILHDPEWPEKAEEKEQRLVASGANL